MPNPIRHFKEEIQDWLDQRLDATIGEEVARHLEMCAECRREYESLSWTKGVAARQFAPKPAPPELRAGILNALRTDEPPRTVVMPPPGFWQTRRRSLFAVAALVTATLAGLYFLRPAPLPEIVMRDYRAYQAGKLSLQLATADVNELESFFAARGIPFQTRVFDLRMMNYQLVGGRAQSIRRRPSAAFVYRGANGQVLLCQMFPGQVADLPSGAVERENKGITFYVYRAKGLTAVFWQEGTIVCALVSDMVPQDVTELAFAKARSIRE